MLSRRSFFKTAGLGAAVAATASFPTEVLSWAEPQRASQPGGPVLLNSNENAYGPLPSVLALKNPFQDVNRYPDRSYDGLLDSDAATLDNHNGAAFNTFLGFDFRHPRTNVLYNDVHYETYERDHIRIHNVNSRKIVLVKRPV